jgi:hypothetical protein
MPFFSRKLVLIHDRTDIIGQHFKGGFILIIPETLKELEGIEIRRVSV